MINVFFIIITTPVISLKKYRGGGGGGGYLQRFTQLKVFLIQPVKKVWLYFSSVIQAADSSNEEEEDVLKTLRRIRAQTPTSYK